jgi:hypothetical protein
MENYSDLPLKNWAKFSQLAQEGLLHKPQYFALND